jgi:hypothetical protein
MRETSAVLRIVALLVFVPLGLFALAAGFTLMAIGLLAFAGIAFAGLSFSGIDPTCTDPTSRKWFLIAMGFGAIGSLIALIYFGEAIANNDTQTAKELGIPLLGFVSVLWRHHHNLLAIVNRKQTATEPSDKL